MKKRNGPPIEFIMPLIEPSFSSATVVNTFGHKEGLTGDLIDGKPKGPKKLPLNMAQPENKVTKIAVEMK